MAHNHLIALTPYRITVLLVDDQTSIGEAVRRMLSTEQDIEFHHCQNPIQAIKLANQIYPTVILQDLVMPEIDGLKLVQYFRVNPATRDVPLIVLSVTEDASVKAEAFSKGANDYMVKFPDRLEVIARIRYHSKGYITLLQKNETYEKLSLSMKEEQERTREMTLLNHMSDLFQACKTEEDTYSVIANVGKLLFPSDSGYLFLLEHTQTILKVVTFWGKSPVVQEFTHNDCQAITQKKPVFIDASKTKGMCAHLHMSPEHLCLCLPITITGEVEGILSLCFAKPEPAQSEDAYNHMKELRQMVATRVATHFALSLSNIRLREALRSESIHDPLTGLYNRRYMEQSLAREIPRAKRHNFQVGFIMLDIDHFKTFNDTHGHEFGDMMLRKLGMYLKEGVRNEDISCRYGGEEFMLVLPDISLQELTKQAENLCLGIRKEVKIEQQDTILSITISLGVACFPEHGTDIQEIIKASNIALHQAKTKGGNNVVISKLKIED